MSMFIKKKKVRILKPQRKDSVETATKMSIQRLSDYMNLEIGI